MDNPEKVPGNTRRQKLLGVSLPGNSDTQKREMKKIEKMAERRKVKGKVVKKKTSLGTKFAETFLATDSQNVMDYIVQDVLIPALKSMMSDMVTGGIEMVLFGDRQSRKSTRGDKRMVSYSNFFQDQSRPDRQSRKVYKPRGSKLDELFVDSRRDGDIVLETLDNVLEDFRVVTVADLLGSLEIESDYTDDKMGWTNLTKFSVTRHPDGYKINVPKPERLD